MYHLLTCPVTSHVEIGGSPGHSLRCVPSKEICQPTTRKEWKIVPQPIPDHPSVRAAHNHRVSRSVGPRCFRQNDDGTRLGAKRLFPPPLYLLEK